MGVTIDAWRARIGRYASAGSSARNRASSSKECPLDFLMVTLAVGVIGMILVIGGVEQNPGPFPCSLCHVVPETIASSIRHQHSHAKNRSFIYSCPVSNCGVRSASYAGMDFHVSQMHRLERHIDPEATLQLYCNHFVDDNVCPFSSTSLVLLVHHLYTHLEAGIDIECPIVECQNKFKKKTALQVHLSLYHKNWRAEGCPKKSLQKSARCPVENLLQFEESPGAVVEEENVQPMDHSDGNGTDNLLMDDQIVLDAIGKFYLNLYGEKLLPETTIQTISESLSFLTQVTHARMKLVLKRELGSLNISEEEVNRIANNVLQADRLYTSHHKRSMGPYLTSHYFRIKYFKERFNYLVPEEINLDPEDPDSQQRLQYISVKETLSILFNDPSIVQEIQKSFEYQQEDENKISDYVHGTLYKSENHPKKEIHLHLYQDSFNPVINVLGSAKNKYKALAMYFTLGNLRPFLRSKIDSKFLLMLIRESVFKEIGAEKCLEKAMSELRSLETEGIDFMGENIKVVVEFMLGDNLGQHMIGGFIESFSTKYMCRFCDITKTAFLNDPSSTNPQRTVQDYNRCVMRATLTGKICKGVKASCVLNGLKYFHATSHLPPCLAHDLFEGVVSWDMSGIIARFVEKGWFSYKLLNRRIRGFKLKGTDKRNAPASVNTSGEKLGGHAVQNWTLLRLFYLIIGDKIQDFEDPAWKLYLKLKEICDMICAPFFFKSDGPYLKDVLLPAYFELRASVLDQTKYNLKPKHHLGLAHCAENILKYGSLLHLWTLPYEQKFKMFKELLRNTRNFINSELSMAERHQMRFCYRTLESLFDHVMEVCDPRELSGQKYSSDLKDFLANLNLTGWVESKKVIANYGIEYKQEHALLLSQTAGVISVGTVKLILSKEEDLQFVVEERLAKYNAITGLYEINLESLSKLSIVPVETLKYPVPHPLYPIGEKLVFSLKHCIADNVL